MIYWYQGKINYKYIKYISIYARGIATNYKQLLYSRRRYTYKLTNIDIAALIYDICIKIHINFVAYILI